MQDFFRKSSTASRFFRENRLINMGNVDKPPEKKLPICKPGQSPADPETMAEQCQMLGGGLGKRALPKLIQRAFLKNISKKNEKNKPKVVAAESETETEPESVAEEVEFEEMSPEQLAQDVMENADMQREWATESRNKIKPMKASIEKQFPELGKILNKQQIQKINNQYLAFKPTARKAEANFKKGVRQFGKGERYSKKRKYEYAETSFDNARSSFISANRGYEEVLQIYSKTEELITSERNIAKEKIVQAKATEEAAAERGVKKPDKLKMQEITRKLNLKIDSKYINFNKNGVFTGIDGRAYKYNQFEFKQREMIKAAKKLMPLVPNMISANKNAKDVKTFEKLYETLVALQRIGKEKNFLDKVNNAMQWYKLNPENSNVYIGKKNYARNLINSALEEPFGETDKRDVFSQKAVAALTEDYF